MSEYALKNGGENLYQLVFNQVTDEQIQKLGIKTDQQRMDSTQLLSHIADLSRLELLIQVIQRLHRLLDEADQQQYAEIFAPFIGLSAGQYTYRIKGKQAVWERIQQIGIVLYDLLGQLAGKYSQEDRYQVAQRFFEENFQLEETQVRAKTNSEIQAGCLQSLDDLEASYRKKGNRTYKGYVGNLSETCHPDNPLQLIVYTRTAENRKHDTHLLDEDLPELKARTGLEQLVTDGGYVGPEIDQDMREQGVEHITTGLTGTLPDHQDGKLALSDFEMELDQEGHVLAAVCPAEQSATVSCSPSGKSFPLLFSPEACQQCAFYQDHQCPVRANPKKTRFWLTVPKDRASSSQRRRRFERCKEEARQLRPAIEGTIFQVKHALRGGKLRVRGLFRVGWAFTGSALATNLRRIHRYENNRQRGKLTSKRSQGAAVNAFLTALGGWLRPFYRPLLAMSPDFGC